MHAIALSLLLGLLLAPEGEKREMRYSFKEGMVYEETTERSFVLEGEGEAARWEISSRERLRRTILEVDDSDHPAAERVEVLEFRRDVKASPEEKLGVSADPAEGKTFVWRRLEERWGLFDASGDVTARFPKLVARLRNWRDARLPGRAVAVGDKWEIDAKTYLETSGFESPDNVKGLAVFRLEEVGDDGVARVSFRFEARHGVERWQHEGTWRFDLERGRDLELSTKGTVTIRDLVAGSGVVSMRRTVVYR